MENKEIAEKLKTLQLGRAKVKVYKDLVTHLTKYCATLQRKLNDANKRLERLGQRDKTSDAYCKALDETLVLQTVLVEARDLHIEILEKAIKYSDELTNTEKAFTEMATQVFEEEDNKPTPAP